MSQYRNMCLGCGGGEEGWKTIMLFSNSKMRVKILILGVFKVSKFSCDGPIKEIHYNKKNYECKKHPTNEYENLKNPY